MATDRIPQRNRNLKRKGTVPSDGARALRCAFYRRVSSAEQVKGTSLDDQLERLNLIAELEGYEVAGDYWDEASGTDNKRRDLQRLLSDARRGEFSLVIVTKLDRLFRNTRLLLNYLHELQSCGVDLLAHGEGINTRKPGMATIILALIGAIAEWEGERIRQRTKEARAYRTARGEWSSGRTPYGYRFDPAKKELAVHEPEAEVVRYIYRLYSHEGMGHVRLAELLNTEGKPTPRPSRKKTRHWTKSTVSAIIKHPGYRGGPSEQWPFTTPPIVSPELWQVAQQRAATNRHVRPLRDTPWLLQGLLRCSICGNVLRTALDHPDRNGGFRRYECPSRRRDLHLNGSARCTLPRLPAEWLEMEITNKILELFRDPKLFVERCEDYIQDMESHKVEVERLLRPTQEQIDHIHEEMDIIDTMLRVHRIEHGVYETEMVELQSKLRSLEQHQRELDPELVGEYHALDNEISTMREAVTQVMDRLDRLPLNLESRYKGGSGLHTVWDWAREDDMVDFVGSPRELMIRFNMSFLVYPDHIEARGALPMEAVVVGVPEDKAGCR